MFAVVLGASFPKRSDPDFVTKRVEETRLLVLHPAKHKHRPEPLPQHGHTAYCITEDKSGY